MLFLGRIEGIGKIFCPFNIPLLGSRRGWLRR